MPVFNGAKILDRAIGSLCRQTFPHWELLAVDDASIDDSHDRLLRWSGRDPRIKVFRLSENRGPSAARNEGLRNSAGSLVTYLDHDDKYYRGYLEQVDRLGDRADVFVFGYDRVRDDGACRSRIRTWVPVVHHRHLFSRNIATPLGVAHRRELIDRVGGFDERLRYQEDWDLWKRFACAGARFLYPPARSGLYHARADRLSRERERLLDGRCLDRFRASAR
jgi:glycosyltransferase involved in cell wall biosynthesis